MLILLEALKFQRNSDDLERFARLHKKTKWSKERLIFCMCVWHREMYESVYCFAVMDLDFCAFLSASLLFLRKNSTVQEDQKCLKSHRRETLISAQGVWSTLQFVTVIFYYPFYHFCQIYSWKHFFWLVCLWTKASDRQFETLFVSIYLFKSTFTFTHSDLQSAISALRHPTASQLER